MEIMEILRLVQFILSIISATFVISMVIAKFITYVKLKHIEMKDMKEKKIETKEKELFLELSKKYGSKVLADLTEAKKNEK